MTVDHQYDDNDDDYHWRNDDDTNYHRDRRQDKYDDGGVGD